MVESDSSNMKSLIPVNLTTLVRNESQKPEAEPVADAPSEAIVAVPKPAAKKPVSKFSKSRGPVRAFAKSKAK